jgi:hypothetical protein
MLNLVSAHIIHLILENDFYLYSHKLLYFARFQTSCRCFQRRCKACPGDVVRVHSSGDYQPKGQLLQWCTMSFYCDQKLETHSVFFSQVLLPKKPAWLAWLGSDTALFRQFSHDSIQTSPDDSNLKLDVILVCL